MKNKNLDCITANPGDSMGSKLSMQKPNQLWRRREVFETSCIQKKIQDPFFQTILWNLSKLAKSRIGIMRDTEQIRNKRNCRTKCTTSERRHFARIGLLEQRLKFYPTSSEDQGPVHQFGTKDLAIFMVCALNAVRSCIGDLLIVDTEDLKAVPPSEILIKRFQFQEVDIHKRGNELVIPCRTGRTVARRTAVVTRCAQSDEATSRNNFNTIFPKKKKQEPEIQVQILMLDKISEVLWENA